MKRTFTILLVAIPFFLLAQNFVVSPSDTLYGEYTNTNEWVSDYIYVKNMSGNTMTINYEMLENSFLSDWSVTMCTSVGCYPNPPQSGTLGTVANEEEGFFNCHAGFWDFAGYGVISYKVFDANDPSVADTLTFAYNITEENTTSTDDLGLEYNFQVSPNPTNGVFNVSNDQLNTFDVKVFSLNGQLVLNDKSQNSSWTGDISSLPSGNYFVMVTDYQKLIYKTKILKQ